MTSNKNTIEMQNTIKLNETIDRRYALWLLHNITQNKVNVRSSHFVEDSKEYTIEYCKKIIVSKTGTIRTTYKQKNGQGRFFATGCNLQKLPRDARHTLCSNDYYDIDIVNSQPTILAQYFEKNAIKCPQLKVYLEYRSEVLKGVMELYELTKDEAKMIFISILNGGGKPKYTDQFIIDFYHEVQDIKNKLIDMEENEKILNEAKSENKVNIKGSVMCARYQIIENEIMQCARDFFTKRKYNVDVLVFDGFMIRKTKAISEELLDELNDHVFNVTGYEVEFILKPMNEGFIIPKEELEEIDENIVESSDGCEQEEFIKDEATHKNKDEGTNTLDKLKMGDYGHAQLFYDFYKENIIISQKFKTVFFIIKIAHFGYQKITNKSLI